MAGVEDSATLLEQFMQDAANLPAEICHMMEEIQAKDQEIQKYQTIINTRDGTLQKHLKLSGSLNVHPKEKEYSEHILKNYDLCQELQDQKISLSDKACRLLDRQVKMLDIKIRDLQSDGQLVDGPPISSLFNRKSAHPDSGRGYFAEMNPQSQQPLQTTSGNAAAGPVRMSPSTHRLNSHRLSPLVVPPPSSRISQLSAPANLHPHPRNSAPATPAPSAHRLQQQASSQRQRESSAGAKDHKKRRLNLGAGSLPSQSSTLRQSSLGPGTPKAGTPAGGASRSGSAGPRSTFTQNAATKKSVGTSRKMVPHHQQINKLKGKPLKRLAGTKRKGVSPSSRSRNNNNGDEEEPVLSSADDTDASTTSRSRRGRGSSSGGTASRSTPVVSNNSNNNGGGININGHKQTHRSKSKSHAGSGDDDEEEEDVDVDVDMVDANDAAAADEGEEEAEEEEEGEEEEEEQEDDRKYCFCQKVSYGEMVGCENDKCAYEWFHLNCVGLKEAPRDQDVWYCPKCEPIFTAAAAAASTATPTPTPTVTAIATARK